MRKTRHTKFYLGVLWDCLLALQPLFELEKKEFSWRESLSKCVALSGEFAQSREYEMKGRILTESFYWPLVKVTFPLDSHDYILDQRTSMVLFLPCHHLQ